jgi:hypothetical protein
MWYFSQPQSHRSQQRPQSGYELCQDPDDLYNPGADAGEFRASDGQNNRELDFVGNVIIMGPNSTRRNPPIVNLKPRGSGTFAVYLADNLVEGAWPLVEEDDVQWLVDVPSPTPPVPTMRARDVLAAVLVDVGASTHRDDVDELLIDNVWSGGGQIIDHPREVDPDW